MASEGAAERKLRAMFDQWIPRLGLDSWEIAVVVEKMKPATTTMRTTKSPNYQRARIIVQPWVLTAKPPGNWHKAASQTFAEEIKTTVVHELLHLVFWDAGSTICLLRRTSKAGAFGVAVAVQEAREELAVDNLSRALVRSWQAERP